MNIVESTIERLAWYLVFIIFIGEVVGLIIATSVLHNLKQQQQDFHNSSINTLNTIEQNQIIQTQSIKQSFICIVNLPPTDPNVKAEAIVCLSSVPAVKQ